MTSSHQKRTYSDADDDDDDESDDDMELSRISEMVKRKKLAAAERSEKAKTAALESRSTASDGQSAKEDLCGNMVHSGQNLPSIAATKEESLIKPKVKSDNHMEVDSDETSKTFKRKRKASEKPKEKMVPKSQDICDDKLVYERLKTFRRKRRSSEKTKDKRFFRNDDTDDVDDESVAETSKNLRRKRTTLEKPKEKMDPQNEEIFDDDDKSVDEVSKKFNRKRKTSEKTKETSLSRNDDIDDINDQPVDETSKKFKRKRKTSAKTREKTFPKSEDAETDDKSVIRRRKKLRKTDDLVESTPVPKRAYRKKKAQTTRSDDDDDDDDEVDDDVEAISKDNERNKAASKLLRKSSLSDSSLSKPDRIQLVEKNDNIVDDIVSPQGHSPPREFCTKSFDNNPYISDISDAECDESAVNTNEGKITSDMFRANIFTNVLEKLSDQSPATDQHSFSEPQSDIGFSEPQSDVGFSDQATDNESVKNAEKDGMKRDVNKEKRRREPLKEKEMSTGEKCVPPKEAGVDILLEASSTDVVKLEDNKTKSEKMQKRKRLSSREFTEDKDSVKVDKRKDHKQDVVADVKAGKLKEDEKAVRKSKKRRRSETEESKKKRHKSESSSKELFRDQSGDKSMEECLDYDSKKSSDERETSKKEIKNDLDDGEVAVSKLERESKKKPVHSRLDSSEGSISYKKKEDTNSSKSPKVENIYYHEHEISLDSKKKKSLSTKSKLGLAGMTSSSDSSDGEAFLDVVRLPVEKKKKSKLDPDLKDDTLKLSTEVDRDSKRDIDPHKVRKVRHDSSSKPPIDVKTKESKKHKAKDSKPGKSDSDASLHRKKSMDKDSEDSKGVELKFNEFTKASEKEKYGNSEEKVRKTDMSGFKSEKHKKLSPVKDSKESKVSTKETKESKALFKKSKEAKKLGTDSKSFPQEKEISSKDNIESVSSSKESRETKSPHKKSMDSKVLTKEQTRSSSKEAKVSKTLTKEAKSSSKETSETSSVPKESMESESPSKKSHDLKTFTKESEKFKASYKEPKELKSLLKETKISSKDTPESSKPSKESKESKSPFKKSNDSKTFPRESEQSKSSSKESKDIKISSKELKESKLAAKQSKVSKLSSSKDYKDSKATNLKDLKIAPKEPKVTPIKAKRESKDVDLKIWDFGLQLTPVMKVSKSGKSQTKSKESKKIKSSESRNRKERDSKFLDQRQEPKSLEKEKPRAPQTSDVCLPSAVEGAESSSSLIFQKKSEKTSMKPMDKNLDVDMLKVSKERDSLDPLEALHGDGSPPKVTTPLPSPEGRKQSHDEPTCIEEDLKPDENVTDFPPEEVDSLEACEKHPIDGSDDQDEAPKGALKATEVPVTEIKLLAEDIKPRIEEWKNPSKDKRMYVEGAEKDKEIVVKEYSKPSVQPRVEDAEPISGSNSEHPGRCEPKEEVSGAVVDDIGSAIDDTVVKRRSLSDIEDIAEKEGSIDNNVSVAGDKVMKRRSLSDIEDIAEKEGSIDNSVSVAGDKVMKRRSLSDIEDIAEKEGSIDGNVSVAGDKVTKRRSLSDIESLAETRESKDEARSSADDLAIKCRSLSEIEDLTDKRGSTADGKCGAGGLVLKRGSVSDIEDLVETRGSVDDTKSVAGDQAVIHSSLSGIEGLAETNESIDDLRSVSGDEIAKSGSLSDSEDLAETRGPTNDTKFVVDDQVVKHHSLSDIEEKAETKGPIDDTRPVVKRHSVSEIENLAETALVASDAVSMDSPRSPHKKSDTSSTNLESLTSWPKGEETKITTATDEEVKDESTCDDGKTELPLHETPPHEKEVKDNEHESKTVTSLQEVDKPAAESIEEKDRPEVDGSETDESKAAENKVHELHEDGISDLGAVSDLEEHLGPFHGTKLEETDIDIKELSHPEETLKILTQELRNSHAAREEHKDTEHDFASVKMTGHDFSMLSEEINDKIQRLSSRSFVSELSEEDRHIVNISMEIAENLSQNRDENVDNTLEAIDDIDKDVMGDSCQESLDSSVAEFDKDSNEISGTSSPVTQQGKDIGIVGDKSNDTGLSTTKLSTNADNGNKGMDSDKLTAVGGPADIKTSITKPRLDFNESSSTATTTASEHKVSRTVDTESPVTSQVTDAVCRPTYTRARTVDLEPRGIAQVVADIDLNSISHCIMDNSGTAREAPPASDNITGPKATKEIEKIDDESLITRPDGTEAAHEVSRDSLKKSISPTFPSTWRKALLRDHVKLSQALPASYERFAVVNGNYQLGDGQSEGEV